MSWVEVFAVFVVCHLAGDFILQTDWQARHKDGGLGGDPDRRRALFSHLATYTLCFLPALAWIASELDLGRAVLAGILVALPHLIQDDGRLLDAWILRVKGPGALATPGLRVAVDQAFHVLALFGLALLVVA